MPPPRCLVCHGDGFTDESTQTTPVPCPRIGCLMGLWAKLWQEHPEDDLYPQLFAASYEFSGQVNHFPENLQGWLSARLWLNSVGYIGDGHSGTFTCNTCQEEIFVQDDREYEYLFYQHSLKHFHAGEVEPRHRPQRDARIQRGEPRGETFVLENQHGVRIWNQHVTFPDFEPKEGNV